MPNQKVWTTCMSYIGQEDDHMIFMNSWDKNYPNWIKLKIKKSDCLHDNCTSCDGTGIRKDGLGTCVHMMSCSCSKHSPRM